MKAKRMLSLLLTAALMLSMVTPVLAASAETELPRASQTRMEETNEVVSIRLQAAGKLVYGSPFELSVVTRPADAQYIGVVLGGEGIPTCLTTPQVGKVMAGIYTNWDAAAYADYCKRFELPEKKRYADYSTGMKMKQCLAVALSHHPKLLLLDEATSGLDPVVRDELIDLLLDFVRDENHAILISSHIVSDLEKLCDTIAFLHKGKLLLCEDKDTLREEYALWHGTAGQLEELDKNAIVSRRVTAYGAEALVKRELVPAGSTLTPVSIEELFGLMVKGENVR